MNHQTKKPALYPLASIAGELDEARRLVRQACYLLDKMTEQVPGQQMEHEIARDLLTKASTNHLAWAALLTEQELERVQGASPPPCRK